MIKFSVRGILLDIEGTTSSVSFVYDVMFPFVRRELEAYLNANWKTQSLRDACNQIAADAGHRTLADWSSSVGNVDRLGLVRDEVIRLMDGDIKATGLKQLQGLIWRSGFENGEMQAHVYDDVLPAVKHWNESGFDVRIYSSGSIAAQRLFFGHTIQGDMLDLFGGHYDTTTGPKKEPQSYTAIAADFPLEPAEILFASDVMAELEAARDAGMKTVLCVRPGNGEVPPDHGFDTISSFAELNVALSAG